MDLGVFSDLQGVIIPTAMGIFAGLFGPLLIEKWKGKKEGDKDITSLKIEFPKLQEDVKALEEKFRKIELKLATVEGLIEGRHSPDASQP